MCIFSLCPVEADSMLLLLLYVHHFFQDEFDVHSHHRGISNQNVFDVFKVMEKINIHGEY